MTLLNFKNEDNSAKIAKINNLPKKYYYLINIHYWAFIFYFKKFNLIDGGFHNLWFCVCTKKIKIIKALESIHSISPRQRFLVKDRFGYISTMDWKQLKK